MAFQPGQSGNPGGRPRATAELRTLAQTAGIDALHRVIELTKHEDPRVALDAAKIVLERGFGRPAQPITGDEDSALVVRKIELVIVDTEGASSCS